MKTSPARSEPRGRRAILVAAGAVAVAGGAAVTLARRRGRARGPAVGDEKGGLAAGDGKGGLAAGNGKGGLAAGNGKGGLAAGDGKGGPAAGDDERGRPVPGRPGAVPATTKQTGRARRRWAALVLVAVLAVILGATAERLGDRARPTATAPGPVARPSWMPSSAAPRPAGAEVPVGTLVSLHRNDVTSDVTLSEVSDPAPGLTAPAGARAVSVLVSIHNTGERAYPPKAELYTWAADSDGRWFAADFALTDAVEPVPGDDLAPGWTRKRVVVFVIPGDARLSRFRFALGLGDTAPAEDWTLA